MITEAVLSELEAACQETGIKIIISVPGGEEIAILQACQYAL